MRGLCDQKLEPRIKLGIQTLVHSNPAWLSCAAPLDRLWTRNFEHNSILCGSPLVTIATICQSAELISITYACTTRNP